ncbi:hypothetical protein [Bdellovibrio bacteriovorus]|uniref:hypothetical protein n=1 Tax=Bdellovibrio bacteriovorus TaxID=959 RepID=UPI003AA7D7E1
MSNTFEGNLNGPFKAFFPIKSGKVHEIEGVILGPTKDNGWSTNIGKVAEYNFTEQETRYLTTLLAAAPELFDVVKLLVDIDSPEAQSAVHNKATELIERIHREYPREVANV